MKKFKILSLDGGGTWALFQVRALQQIYGVQAPGHRVLEDFDLVAANSGGSIAAAGLFANLPLDRVMNLFLDQDILNAIFFKSHDIIDAALEFLLGVGPKYRTDKKLAGLQGAFAGCNDDQGTPFGNLSMSDAARWVERAVGHPVKFIVTSFDYDTERAVYFRSHPSLASSSATNAKVNLLEAVHASSTPPILYFDHPARVDGSRYWDGGLAGLNNPVLAAVIEGLIEAGSSSSIYVLSIGTGMVRLPVMEDGPPIITAAPAKSSLTHDINLAAGNVLDDPPDAASFEAYVALGLPLPSQNTGLVASERFVRLNPRIGPEWVGGAWTVPPYFKKQADKQTGLELFKQIAGLRLDATKPEDLLALRKLADAWVTGSDVPNQGIRSDSFFNVQMGYADADSGIRAWKSFLPR